MKLIFANGAFKDKRSSFKVIQLNGTWYVVGQGYLFQVDTCQEGFEVVEQLKAGHQENQQRL